MAFSINAPILSMSVSFASLKSISSPPCKQLYYYCISVVPNPVEEAIDNAMTDTLTEEIDGLKRNCSLYLDDFDNKTINEYCRCIPFS